MGRWRSRGIAALVLVLGLGLRVADPPILAGLRARCFDLMQEVQPRAYVPVPVRVVNIDDESLARLGQWPWPRTTLAELVSRLQKLGVAVVALDIVLAEADRTSPADTLRQVPDVPPDVSRWIESLPNHDHVLAETIRGAPVVTGFALTTTGGGRPPALRVAWATGGDSPLQFAPGYGGAVTTLPEIEAAAAGNGSLNVIPDSDHTMRRVPLVVRYQNQLYPSLVAEALRVAQGANTDIILASGAHGVTSFGARTGITRIRIGAFTADTDGSGAVWLYDTGRLTQRTIPAWKIMDGSAAANSVQGAIVFIGAGATGLGDIAATPLSLAVPGAEIDAQITEQILLHNFLLRPDWASGAELFYLIVLGIGLIFGLSRFGPAWSAAATAAIFAAAFLSSWYAFTALHMLFDPVYPSFVALCIYLTSSLLKHLETEGEKRRVRHAFGHYLPETLVEELVTDPSKLQLGGELKRMTFLFSDIRGFTSIAERCKSRPEAVTDIINRFTTRMTEAIFRHGGTIDKYMGDCVMAFWNAPTNDPDHARHACEAALEMLAELQRLNEELATESSAIRLADGQTLSIQLGAGIGINTGDCIVGNLGSEMRFNYSVIGDAVNLASRVEGETKKYGVHVIIGEETERLATGLATLELDIVAVKGKLEELPIYALLGDEQLASEPEFAALKAQHTKMLTAYRNGDLPLARELIVTCRKFRTDLASLYNLYAERIAEKERAGSTEQEELPAA